MPNTVCSDRLYIVTCFLSVSQREKELHRLNEQVASETEQRQAFESKCQDVSVFEW